MNIEIKLNNYNQALNEFNPSLLANSLDNYLVESLKRQNIKSQQLIITIKGLNSEELAKLTKIIHKYYQDKLTFYKEKKQITNYLKLAFFLIGILAIIISRLANFIFNELILIIGWVIIWELFHNIIFEQLNKAHTASIYAKLSKCKIN